MRKQHPNYFVLRGDSFDLSFITYFDDERLQKAHDILNDRKYTAKETNISYRIANHWKSLGLLPEGILKTDGWSKFTPLELIWVRIVIKIREFGLPLEKIAEIKEYILDWNEKTQNYPLFEYYVGKAWLSEDDAYVVVASNGFADLGTGGQIEISKHINAIPSHILQISLKAILQEAGFKIKAARPLHALSKAEEDLLAAIRIKPNKEIKVKVDDERRITGIEEIQEELNPEEINKAYHDMKQAEAYGEVNIKYEKGKPIHKQVSYKKRYKTEE